MKKTTTYKNLNVLLLVMLWVGSLCAQTKNIRFERISIKQGLSKSSINCILQAYQGSINDVITLENCIEHLKLSDINNITFILDRGFFSKTNLLVLSDNEREFNFLQPVPMSVKAAKELSR